ncbi:MAG: PAS domain S-box protein [Nitrosomonadaceae bacterium]|nr:PAS domain S-box protein [Nitrosomonadaceae bacterium]
MFLTRDDRKISIIGGLLLMGLTLATGIAVYGVMRQQIESTLGRGLDVALQGKARLFESQIAEGLASTRALAARPFLVQSMQQLNAQPDSTSALHDLERNVNSLTQAGFTAASVSDMRGNKLAQVGRFSRNQAPSLPLHSHNNTSLLWDGQLILRTSKDVLDQDGRRIGSVTTKKDLPQLTRSFSKIREIGKTGEFMLCAPLGADGQEMACFLSKVDSVEFKRQMPRIIGGIPLPMNYALEGKSGIIATKDYRRVPVVAAYAPLGVFGLGMVLKLDEEELYSPVTGQIKTIALYLAALVIAGILLLHWLMLPLVRKLLHAKEIAEQTSAELTAYIAAIGKLALVSVADCSGRILQANAIFCEVSGYSEQELIGQDHRILNSGTHPKAFFTEMWATIACGDVWHQEICNRSKSGALYWLDSAIVPLKDNAGKIDRYLSVRVDITARKQKEIVLRERLKESACLSAIRHEMKLELPVDEFCQKIIAHLQGAMQFPEIATAVIELDGRQFISAGYDKEQTHGLQAQVTVNGKACGGLQVFYSESKLFLLPEEQDLIDAISSDLGRWLERRQAEQALQESHDRLENRVWQRTDELLQIGRRLSAEIAERRSAQQMVQQSREQLRKLIGYQENIKEEERRRIASEIHDELGSELTGIKAYLSVMIEHAQKMRMLPDHHLLDAADLADAAIKTVRRVITDLRPSVLDQLGLWAALEWYASQIEERSGLCCEFVIDKLAAATEIDPERSTAIFRIVQETLTNVVRHARASRVIIQVKLQGSAVMVEVVDDGSGITAERLLNPDSWGIIGMHERARYFGGELKITGTPGQGTSMLLHMPLGHADGH